jgi:predicted DNA-binding protein with PD1-like motif
MSVFRSCGSFLKNSSFHFSQLKQSHYQERRNAGWMLLKASINPDFHLTVRSYGDKSSIKSSSGKKQDLMPPVDGNDLVSVNKPGPNQRRPPGRPAGSKNKHPKPKRLKLLISDSPNALQSHILEVSGGSNIPECLTNFVSKIQRGLCIMSGSGTVTNVTLKQSSSPDAIVSLQGRFEILSLSGSILPRATPPVASGLTISLASGHGQVMGGCVVGPLISVGPVVVMAASFESVACEKLSREDGVNKVNNSSK